MTKRKQLYPGSRQLSSTQDSAIRSLAAIKLHRKGHMKFKHLLRSKKIIIHSSAELPTYVQVEFRKVFKEKAEDVVGEVSRLVKLYIPLKISTWKSVPEELKARIYVESLENFNATSGEELSDVAHVQSLIDEVAKRRYRKYRHQLYDHYLSFENDQNRLQNAPEAVNIEDWTWLVNYFGSPNYQANKQKNKTKRPKQVINHATNHSSLDQISPTEQGDEGHKSLLDGCWRLMEVYPESTVLAYMATVIVVLEDQVRRREELILRMQQFVKEFKEEMMKEVKAVVSELTTRFKEREMQMKSQLNEGSGSKQ